MLRIFGALVAWLVMSTNALALDPGCTTTNLFEDLAVTAPEDYAALRAEIDAIPNARGIFWEVVHPDVDHTSYLFGTFHKADPRILDLPDSVDSAFGSVDTVAVELANPRGQMTLTISMATNPGKFFATDGRRLSQTLDPDTIGPLTDFLVERDVNFAEIDVLRPWVSISVLSVSTCDLTYGGLGAKVLDEALIDRAKETGKTVVGLETIREQMDTLAGVDEDFYLASLEDTARLHAAGLLEDLLRTSTQLYLAEDVAALLPLSIYYSHLVSPDQDLSEGYAHFEERLLSARNIGMTENAADLILAGPTFVAVGAAHLYGETGLVAGLRNKGFTVTRIPLKR